MDFIKLLSGAIEHRKAQYPGLMYWLGDKRIKGSMYIVDPEGGVREYVLHEKKDKFGCINRKVTNTSGVVVCSTTIYENLGLYCFVSKNISLCISITKGIPKMKINYIRK